MQLRDEFIRSGAWLFRHRSHLPLFLLWLLMWGAWVGSSPATARDWGSVYRGLCVGISLLGLAIRVLAVGHAAAGTSGRNVRAQKAQHLNTTGVYSIVRHPLYVGNFLMALGVFMFTEVWWAFVIYALAFWVYYERIAFAEEAFLEARFGDDFELWARRTPAFLPDPRRYRAPGLAFSFRKALRREHPGLLAVVVAFALVDAVGTLAETGRLAVSPGWAVALIAALTCYLVLRTLKKRTSLLSVEGR